MTDHDGFRVERDGVVATITLDVPGKLNRVSMPARDQLSAVFAELDADDEVRFVVLTGAGGAFTAGGDIAGFLERSPWIVSQLARNVAAPERCSKPVIARLQGYVFGVGLELALACDFRIACRRRAARPPRGDDRDDPGLGRDAAPRADGRSRSREGHRHARPPRAGGRGARARPRRAGRAGGGARRRGRVARRGALRPLAARARDGEARAERGLRQPAPRRARARRARVRAPAADGTTSGRASRPSSRSGGRSSPGSDGVEARDIALRNADVRPLRRAWPRAERRRGRRPRGQRRPTR